MRRRANITTRNEAYAYVTFNHYVDDMSSGKPITKTCRPYIVVSIAPSVKAEHVIGIDVVDTEPPMPTTCRMQWVIGIDFRGKKVLL